MAINMRHSASSASKGSYRRRGSPNLTQLRRFDPPFCDFRRASDWAARGAGEPDQGMPVRLVRRPYLRGNHTGQPDAPVVCLAADCPGQHLLLSVARGPIAEEKALYRALRDGVIGGAALDTWWRYPSADDPAPRPSRYPFHELPNVIMTPHCSPRTDGTIERRSRDVARNIDRFVRGEPLENIVAAT